jgi:hypothetical protein
MPDDRKSVRRLLERPGTYADPATSETSAGWRDAVLAAVPDQAETPLHPEEAPEPDGPLRPRHLLMMSPAGVALFGLGWWVGRGGVTADELAAVPPEVWVACAAMIAAASLAWFGWPRWRPVRSRSPLG